MNQPERDALRSLAEATGRYLNDSAEASPEVRTELRGRLTDAEAAAWAVLRPSVALGRRLDVDGELDAAVNPGAWKGRS